MSDNEYIPHIVLVAENGDQTTGEVGCAASSIAGDVIEAYPGTTYQLGMGGAGPSLRIGESVGSGPGTVGRLLADAGATCRSRSVASHVACAFFGTSLQLVTSRIFAFVIFANIAIASKAHEPAGSFTRVDDLAIRNRIKSRKPAASTTMTCQSL